MQFVGKDCQNDKDIVRSAFENNPGLLKFASKQLRNDKAFLTDLSKQHSSNRTDQIISILKKHNLAL